MIKLKIITFDTTKKKYGDISYSAALLLSHLKYSKINNLYYKHINIDISKHIAKYKHNTKEIEKSVKNEIVLNIFNNIHNHTHIVIAVTAWSIFYVQFILNKISPFFKGKIILGGYEITSLSSIELFKLFPSVDFFIKGYAEKVLIELIKDEKKFGPIVFQNTGVNDLISPYLKGIIPLTKMSSIYWETKRGCVYLCDFCEWGNASQKKMIYIPYDKLYREIQFFKSKKIKSINIVDSVFNVGNNYIKILKDLLNIPNIHITIQSRFENINIKNKKSAEFINLCASNNDRVKIEFGLQTINDKEMKIIGRRNNLEHVKDIMILLQNHKINYEISVIFGIPFQTVNTYLKTIEFIKENGCNIHNIKAYPLRIPSNSKLSTKRNFLQIKEKRDLSSTQIVESSLSFTKEDWNKMNEIIKN